MAGGGSKPGERRGGRPKGQTNKATKAKALLLASVEEQFKASGYDPIAAMIAIAQKARPTAIDSVKFDYHMKLAKKYFPDVAAVKVSGDPEAPIAVTEVRRISYAEQVASQAPTNGHADGH